jgi:polar amino acid transport system substrate-binding protein
VAQARRTPGLSLFLAAFLVCAACGDLPRDPEGTLERIEGGVMRAGVIESDPFATFVEGEPGGIEPRILERFAEELDADIEWFPGSEEELMGALEKRELDVVVGGLTSTTPWSKMATLTHPYLTTAAIVAGPRDSEALDDIAGVEVSVEEGTEEAGLLEKTDAVVVLVEDIANAEGAVAIENWLLDDLGLVDTGVRLAESDHVMATPFGENAWLVRLERYLLTHEDEIKSLLEEEGRP